MFGGTYFAGAVFGGVARGGAMAASLAASLTIPITAQGHLYPTPDPRTEVGIILDGALSTHRVRVAGLEIRDILNDAPNTCRLTIEGLSGDGFPPAVGQSLRITLAGGTLLFTGALQTVEQIYEGLPIHHAWRCTAIDDTARANARRPFGTWVLTSATTIAQAITPAGFSTAGIEAGLPPVSITFDGTDTTIAALARLATAIGGYCKVEDLTVYLFLEDLAAPPDPVDAAHPPLNDPPIQQATDSSQLRTRVYGKGYGEPVAADLLAGETLVPIQDGAQFAPAGGQVISGATPDGAQSNILSYASVQRRGDGALVGAGAAPTNGPVLALAPGSGVESGVHGYAQVWVTAAGKTTPSALSSITVGAITGIADPTVIGTGGTQARNVVDYVDGTLTAGATYDYKLTHRRIADLSETLPTAAASGPVVPAAGDNIIYFQKSLMHAGTVPPSGCVVVWYRSKNGGGYFECTAVDNASGFYVDNTADANVGHAIPTVNNTTGGNRVSYARVAGPTGTTAREYYRTVAGGSQLKLLATLSDNTTLTAGTDSTADAALGANAPTGDTSGLTLVAGQVNAGAVALPVSSAAPFRSAGGWVLIGRDQVVRYTGVSGGTLTGSPATGPGAITTTVLYGSQVFPAPMLVGVTGVTAPIAKGSTVAIWVQRDDLPAQAAQAARAGGDGIVEFLIIDQRRGVDSLTARCDADLALFAQPIVTVQYATRDVKTKSGKPIAITLPTVSIAEVLTIQEVTITEIDIARGLAPRYSVRASTVRFSLEDVLRRLVAVTPTVTRS
jgi:hypothetical protein